MYSRHCTRNCSRSTRNRISHNMTVLLMMMKTMEFAWPKSIWSNSISWMIELDKQQSAKTEQQQKSKEKSRHKKQTGKLWIYSFVYVEEIMAAWWMDERAERVKWSVEWERWMRNTINLHAGYWIYCYAMSININFVECQIFKIGGFIFFFISSNCVFPFCRTRNKHNEISFENDWYFLFIPTRSERSSPRG